MRSASAIAGKIASPFREFGFAAGLLYAVDRVLSRLSPRARLHVYEMMVQPITGKPLLPRNFNQLEIKRIGPEDPYLALMPIRPDVMRARLEQNATCLGAFRKGQLVGYMWYCTRSYDEDEVRCTYALAAEESSVFDFDFFLFPEHRMGSGFVALWSGANQELYREGIRYTFSRLTRFNLASRRAHKHLGWKLVGRLLFVQLASLEIMLATLFPYVRVSTKTRARITLTPEALT